MSEQTIFRNEHSEKFTVISNSTIQDSSLSLKARGLHHFLLSLPKTWKANINHLSSACEKDGKAAIASCLAELIEAGYVRKEQERDENGRFIATKYFVYESPQSKDDSPITDYRKPDNPQADYREPGNPEPDNPETENRSLIKETFLENTQKKERSFSPKIQKVEERSQEFGLTQPEHPVNNPNCEYSHPGFNPVGNSSGGWGQSSAESFESRYEQSTLPPWKTRSGPNGWNNDVLNYWAKNVATRNPAYDGKKVGRVEAISWFSKALKDEGRMAAAIAVCEEMRERESVSRDSLSVSDHVVQQRKEIPTSKPPEGFGFKHITLQEKAS